MHSRPGDPVLSTAIVIGAGFGGLAAAIRLAARGYRVELFEANEQAGGRAAVWEQDGFHFDAGPTVITAPYLLEELFALHGRDLRDYVELLPVDPFYRVEFADGNRFDYVGDEERILAQIEAMNPPDVDGYRKLAEHARRIFDIGYTQLADTPFDRVSDMLRVVPDLLRLENYRTVCGLVGKYIKDPRLRQAFTFHTLLVGGNPYDTTSIYLLIHWLERKWGVHFVRGGTGQLVKALVWLLEEVGGRIHLNCPVDEILVEQGRTVGVRCGSREHRAEVVVANADPTQVYKHLIARKHRTWHPDWRLNTVNQSMSLFVVYFGTDRPYEDIAHHTIVLNQRYKGLLDDIFRKKVLAEDFSLYLHHPSATDPSSAPPGKDCFYALSPVPNLEGGQNWEDLAEPYMDSILESLEERLMPGLRESIVTRRFIDPRTFATRLRSVSGAAFGPAPIFRQSAWFRFHNRSDDVDGLYFVGAGTHPGAGVPGVLCSAKVLEHFLPHKPQATAAK